MQPPRPEPPRLGTERETLEGFLDFLRATLEWKASGLTDAQLDQRLAPSTMTLGGLLKHLAYVEDWWFTAVLAGQPDPEPWASAPWAEDPDWEWRSAATDTGDNLRRLWQESLARSRSASSGVALDATSVRADRDGRRWSHRWILTHMIEEYARHCGHADLLRESIDGATGE